MLFLAYHRKTRQLRKAHIYGRLVWSSKKPFSLAIFGFVPEWTEWSSLSYVLPIAVGVIGVATLTYKWLSKKPSENISDTPASTSDSTSSEDVNNNMDDFSIAEPSFQDLHPETEFIDTTEAYCIPPTSPQASLDFTSHITFSLKDILSMDPTNKTEFMSQFFIFKQFKYAEIIISPEMALKLKNWCLIAINAANEGESKQIFIDLLKHLTDILSQF